jgi:zinc/manganese transport system ATP-binding protein
MPNKQGLIIQNLTLSYERHPAIHHLNGSFEIGSSTAILGPNGAGKSTLLRALAQLHPIDEGHIHRHGLPLSQTAYLAQGMNLEKDFPINVGQLVKQGFFNERSFVSFSLSAEQKLRYKNALEATNLMELEQKPIRTLSLGQLQRARWARLIAQDAKLILLDEPFTGLDEKSTLNLLQLITKWIEQGRTLIAAIHDEAMAQKYFSHTLLLHKEAIRWGKSPEIFQDQQEKNFAKNSESKENEICIQ